MFDGQFYPFQPIQFMDGLLNPIIGGGEALPAVSYLTALTDNANLATYTFNDVAVSPVAADAYLVFAAGHENSTGRSFTGGTINGVAATELVVSALAASSLRVGLFGLAIPGATEADITFTLNAAAARGAMAAWVLTGLSSTTPIVGGTASAVIGAGSSVGSTVAVADKGITIAVMQNALGGANTTTWTGLTTENFDIDVEATATFSGGVYLPSADNASHAISAAFSGSGGGAAIAMVSFR